jgi:uncharacterized protein YcbK (DUF882 family)
MRVTRFSQFSCSAPPRIVGTAVAFLSLFSTLALADPPAPAVAEPLPNAPRAAAVTAPPPAPHRAANAAVVRAAAPRYRSYVDRWHAVGPDANVVQDEHGRAKLVLVSLNTNDRAELAPRSERGGFDAYDLDQAARVLREPSSGNVYPIEPRLLDLVYRIQTQLAAPEIRVISAYRTPHRRNASNHGRGRAIDLIVPGAKDAEVAKFARELGFVGVGIYPSSGFVHVDVRERSYFWVDASAPGHRNRERGIMRDLALKSDVAAAARGETGLAPFSIGTDVDEAVRAWRATPASAPDSDDDDPSDG